MFYRPIIWKALRISHSEPCDIKLNLWVKLEEYFIVWKPVMKVEFVIDFKSPDTWIIPPDHLLMKCFQDIIGVAHISSESVQVQCFLHKSIFIKHLKLLSGNLLSCRRAALYCSTQSSNQKFSFWWIFEKHYKYL